MYKANFLLIKASWNGVGIKATVISVKRWNNDLQILARIVSSSEMVLPFAKLILPIFSNE